MNRLVKMLIAIRLSGFAIVMVLVFQTTVFGIDFKWTGGDGDWSDPGNWSMGSVPNDSNHVAFIFYSDARIDADQFQVESLFIRPDEGPLGEGSLSIINNGGLDVKEDVTAGSSSGRGSITVSGQDSTLRAHNGTWIGETGKGILNISDGGLYEGDSLYIGTSTGSSGTVTVSGQDSLIAARSVNLGSGHVQMDIIDGGRVKTDLLSNPDQSGSGLKTVTVSGPESHLDSKEIFWGFNDKALMTIKDSGYMSSDILLIDNKSGSDSTVSVSSGGRVDVKTATIGNKGTGALNIENGAVMDISTITYLGGYSHSNGIVTVSGPGSQLASYDILLGHVGNGIMEITDGGSIKIHSQFITGYSRSTSSSAISVSGKESRLTSGDTWLGYLGHGSLDVIDSGQFDARWLFVGHKPTASTTVLVSGLGSRLKSDATRIGVYGKGDLTVSAGGLMDAKGFIVGEFLDSSGAVRVLDNGSLLNTWNAYIGHRGDGTLDIENGGIMRPKNLVISKESSGTGSVKVSGPGSMLDTTSATVGAAGEGRLAVADGGKMITRDLIIGRDPGDRDMAYTNTVTVTGPGSVLESESAAIGYYGKGVLDIVDGGNMVNQGSVFAGYLSGSSGTVSVSGKDSRLESAKAQIGFYSQGTLDITGGGSARLASLELGKYPGVSGIVTVSGDGSRIDTESTWIGNEGDGILNITDGGQVYSRVFSYSQYPDATGTVTVSGPGSRLDTGTAWINYGTGRKLEILDGGHMRSEYMTIKGNTITVSGENSLLSSQKMTLAGEDADPGILITNGGELQVEQFFEIEANGALKVSDGGRFIMGPDSFFNISSPGATAAFTDTAFFDGHVHVNGTLSTPASVFSSGSLLTGSQGVIQGDVTMNGTLSPGGANDPGSSPDTLFINGNYTHEKDSRYVAGIDVDTQVSDRVEVSGSTTLNGGTIEAVWTGHVTGEERFTVLTSSSIQGDFDTLAGDTALVKVAVEKTPESVDIVLTRTDYANVTVNQKKPATRATQDVQTLPNALDDLSLKAGKDMYQVLAALDRMTHSDQILSAYDQMTPSVVAGALAVNLDTLRQIGDLTGRRAASLRSDRSLASHRSLSSDRSLASERSLYIQPFGSASYRGGDHNDPEYRAGTAGILTGIETRSGSFFTGARGIYASSHIAWKDPGQSSSRTDMVSVGFYGGYLADTWDLYASVDTGGLFYDTRRRMVFGGINRTAKASPNGSLFSAQLGGSLDVDLGRCLLRPWASLRYARLMRNQYTEHNAGDLNLTVGDTSVDSLRSTLGFTLSTRAFALPGTGVTLTPEFHGAWYHEFMGDNRFDMVSQLAGGGHPFPTTKAVKDADLFGFGPGLDLDITDTVSGNIRYEGILGDTSMNHNLYAGITVRF
jgi:outer membrane autotransporter protein